VPIGCAGILQLRLQTGETQQIEEAMAVHVAHRFRPGRELVLFHLPG